MENNELYHFGVKGMKWGVRKDRIRTSSRRKAKEDRMSDDAREASRLKKKKLSEMSNAEIRKLNDRTQLEQNYSRLHPSAAKKGLKFVAGAAGVMGTAMNLYNNSDKMVKLGKSVSTKIVDFAGDMVMRDLRRTLNG